MAVQPSFESPRIQPILTQFGRSFICLKGNIEAQGWGMYDFGFMPNSFLVNELPIPPGNFIPEAVNPVCHSFGWNYRGCQNFSFHNHPV
jgi:hypothetical protein